jgi:hypothetical protein
VKHKMSCYTLQLAVTYLLNSLIAVDKVVHTVTSTVISNAPNRSSHLTIAALVSSSSHTQLLVCEVSGLCNSVVEGSVLPGSGSTSLRDWWSTFGKRLMILFSKVKMSLKNVLVLYSSWKLRYLNL